MCILIYYFFPANVVFFPFLFKTKITKLAYYHSFFRLKAWKLLLQKSPKQTTAIQKTALLCHVYDLVIVNKCIWCFSNSVVVSLAFMCGITVVWLWAAFLMRQIESWFSVTCILTFFTPSLVIPHFSSGEHRPNSYWGWTSQKKTKTDTHGTNP